MPQSETEKPKVHIVTYWEGEWDSAHEVIDSVWFESDLAHVRASRIEDNKNPTVHEFEVQGSKP